MSNSTETFSSKRKSLSIKEGSSEKDMARLIFLFAGQGFSYVDEFNSLRARFETREFIERSERILQEEWDIIKNEISYSIPDYFKFDDWMSTEKEYDLPFSISGVFIFVVQVANFFYFAKQMDATPEELCTMADASLGHSQGVNAALLIAMGGNEDSFLERYEKFLRLMFRTIFELAQNSQLCTLSDYARNLQYQQGPEEPTYMASLNIPFDDNFKNILDSYNDSVESHHKIYMGLRNTYNNLSLVGQPEGLVYLRDYLLKSKKVDIKTWQYHNVDGPFHTPFFNETLLEIEKRVSSLNIVIKKEDIKVPVYHPEDGRSLADEPDILHSVLKSIVLDTIFWPAALSPLNGLSEKTRIAVNFGPGDGMVRMSAPILAGNGIKFVSALFPDDVDSIIKDIKEGKGERPWKDYAPKIIEHSDGSREIVNDFTRLTGYSPIFAGGMTPTSVEPDLTIAAANAGYIVELAGGGQVSEELLRARMDVIREGLEPGRGIVFNFLYLDAYLWKLQFPLILQLKKEGYPIIGATISAGMPDIDEAVEILNKFTEAGIWIHSFKPGTDRQIKKVLKLAAARPHHKILMQIEGGAAGGHHSNGKLRSLLSSNYARIRRHKNVVLAVGGGITGPDSAIQWLDGSWNKEQPMPVDGVFIGTALMSAKEAHTSTKIKDELVKLKGTENWESTYDKPAGGVVSGTSGLGADIYYLDNHWSRTSSWLEDLVQSGKDPVEYKDEIIDRVNKTVKPYFGHISEMTYYKVLHRFIELTSPDSEMLSAPKEKYGDESNKWLDHPFIDKTYRSRWIALIEQFESRFVNQHSDEVESILSDYPEGVIEGDPFALLEHFKLKYPDFERAFLDPEDEQFFFKVCDSPGKPVNFISRIDSNIVKYYRSDSLWYSHCEGVDADSCAVIPGPVAIGSISKSEESVSSIFNGFSHKLNDSEFEKLEYSSLKFHKEGNSDVILAESFSKNHLCDCNQTFDESEFPEMDLQMDEKGTVLASISEGELWSSHMLSVQGVAPMVRNWTDGLSRLCHGKLEKFLQSRFMVFDGEIQVSKVSTWLFPEKKELISIDSESNSILVKAQKLNGLDIDSNKTEDFYTMASITDGENGMIEVNLHSYLPQLSHGGENTQSDSIDFDNILSNRKDIVLKLQFEETGIASVPFKCIDFKKSIDNFYREVWFSSLLDNDRSEFSYETKIDSGRVKLFSSSIGEMYAEKVYSPDYLPALGPHLLAWDGLINTVFKKDRTYNFFALLHLEYEISWFPEYFSRYDNDATYEVHSKLIAEKEKDRNLEKRAISNISRDGQPVAAISSNFYLQGESCESGYDYENLEYSIKLNSKGDIDYLNSFEGVNFIEEPSKGENLIWRTTSRKDDWSGAASHCQGGIYLTKSDESLEKIGEFELEGKLESSSSYENPLTLILKPLMKSGSKKKQIVFTEDFYAPEDMSSFAAGSQDCNPLHLSNRFSSIGGQETPIVHGMWSAARVIAIAKRKLLNFDPSRLRNAKIKFTGPVHLGEHLKLDCFFSGIEKSTQVYQLVLSRMDDEPVLECELRLALPDTAHIYTGQGSQKSGMGVDLQKKSKGAAAIWAEADSYTRSQWGFSIKRIVEANPESISVNGVKWSHPEGVLNLTQFTQVALLTYEVAERKALEEDLGHIKPDLFAGHSLGEFSALAGEGILSLEKAIHIVYLRGMLMQSAVKRDEAGNSPWGMTVLKGRSDIGFEEPEMKELISEVSKDLNETLEMVNFNVLNLQYSVVGTITALDELESRIKKSHGDEKSFIRLKGIDIPFHSMVMSSMIGEFRKILQDQIGDDQPLHLLEGRYIPNLTGEPFSSDIESCNKIADNYSSDALKEMLNKDLSDKERARLLLIELLALQFASPVQWIKTQRVILDSASNIDRVIEFGPRPSLKGMLNKTIENFPIKKSIEALSYVEDAVLCNFTSDNLFDDMVETETVKEIAVETESKTAEEPERVIVASEADKSISVNSTKVSSAGLSTIDISLKGADAARAVLAMRANCSIADITDDMGIDDLFAGNSTRRNQVIADLDTELDTNIFDGNYDQSLGTLLNQVESEVTYTEPKAYLLTTIEDMVKRIFSPGFSRKDAIAYLCERWSLDNGGSNGILMRSVLESRAGVGKFNITKRLESESKVKEWLDKVVEMIAGEKGISLQSIETNTSQSEMVDASVIGEIKDDLFSKDGRLVQALQRAQNELTSELDLPSNEKRDVITEEEFDIKSLYEKEHGDRYISVIEPHFSEPMIYTLDNSIQWVKSSLVKSYWKFISGEDKDLKGLEFQLLSHYHTKDDQGICSMVDYFSDRSKELLKEKPELKPFAEMLQRVQSFRGTDLNPEESGCADSMASGIAVQTIGDLHEGVGRALHMDSEKSRTVTFSDLMGNLKNKQDRTEQDSLPYVGKVALLTGVRQGSIASGMAAKLLRGGAHVIIAGRKANLGKRLQFRKLYADNAAYGAKLTMIPCSQGSTADMEKLVSYLEKNKLYPDYLVPFGALPEENDISGINGDESMATLRLMLFGVEFLIGKTVELVGNNSPEERLCNILLPLSPNIGTFGRDGLYGETKIGLHSLLYKWVSEFEYWGKFTKIAGCEIGWVKGTGLMAGNDIISDRIEKDFGVKTFDINQMSDLLCEVLDYTSMDSPAARMFDLSFGLASVPNLGQELRNAHVEFQNNLKIEKRSKELKSEYEKLQGNSKKFVSPSGLTSSLIFNQDERSSTSKGKESIDLEKVICVVGYGEVSAGGSSKTRWELEKNGKLSIEGAIELAWMMNYISYENSSKYSGWVVKETGDKIEAVDILNRYEKDILANTGIRLVDPEISNYDPAKCEVFSEVVLEKDFVIPVSSEQEARQFVELEPSSSEAYYNREKESWSVIRRKGSTILVPKAIKIDRFVAGQIPEGWNAETFGIPKSLIDQVDRITLFNLVGVAQAYISAGLSPEEVFEFIHPAEMAYTVGTVGALGKMKNFFAGNSFSDIEKAGDLLQETFCNVTVAYAVTRMIGSSGTIQTPNGACATSAQSFEIAFDILKAGKAKMVFAGGFDDFTDDSVRGYMTMGATANSQEMIDMGLEPGEHCRPNDTRRGGFVEAHGGGALLLARADVALEMGLPIKAVIAYASTFTDGLQQSIPAPGVGVLGAARKGSKPEELSPLGKALKQFGLNADSIFCVSKHDTSTKKNDLNENEIHHQILKSLGRTKGNPLLTISQKSVVGHLKAGSASAQLIGLVQSLNDGVIPGNRWLENVDPEMNVFHEIVFTEESINIGKNEMKAALFTSLGFGHVGGIGLVIHPDVLLEQVNWKDYPEYHKQLMERRRTSVKLEKEAQMSGKGYATLNNVREKLFSSRNEEIKAYLDGTYRAENINPIENS